MNFSIKIQWDKIKYPGFKIFLSADNGDSWLSNFSRPLTASVYSLLIDSNDDIYAGTNRGVFYSNNNGDNWIEINSGLLKKNVKSLAKDSDGFLFAATDSGIYKSIQSTSKIALKEYKNVESINLHRNYPNPFNSSTTIEFSIPNRQHVGLKIYNLMGQAVETLVDKSLEEGKHHIIFESENISTGIYMAVLQAGNQGDVKKILCLKTC